VRTDLYEACGMSPEEVRALFNEHQSIEPEDVADAVEYALSTPQNVQVNCTILVFYEKKNVTELLNLSDT
jgi:NADP-dependent 3-hydroxy acid dehydrogenase YdfG